MRKNRFAVILAGGTGTRLWPMSRNAVPKQLIPFIGGKCLLLLAFERLEGLVDRDERLVCAGDAHREAILKELPGLHPECYLGEPTGRDTLNALGYAAAVIARRDADAVMGVFTADQIIEPSDRFRAIAASGFEIAEKDGNTLVAFGIAPTHAATGYGYLGLGEPFLEGSRIVTEFKEKPDEPTARRWVSEGPDRYLWNSGMFVWKASTFLDCIRRYEPGCHAGICRIADAWGSPRFQSVISETYPGLRKISVDFAVMEKASRDPRVKVAAVPMDISWLDIGSWSAFAGTCPRDGAGNAMAAATHLLADTSGTLVASSDPDHLVAALGCEDLLIVHTPDATLVCRKDRAEDVKKIHALAKERFGDRFA